MTMPESSSEREQRFERVLADYLHGVEAGQAQDRDALIRQHPDLADELRSFFRNRDAVERLAQPLREQGPPLPETIGAEGSAAGVGTTVRYFGDYELLDEIARGGMGIVFKARQVSLNRVVALKMILEGELATAADVQRFRTEAEAAGNLDHPNIVPIYEISAHNGLHYFSMKLIEGGSLAQQLAKQPPDQKTAARLLATVARAVHYAHQRGVLHRDLKPANILLDHQGQPHVTDFGLAKWVGRDRGQTQSGAIVGTPSYMAPEQASASKGLSIAVDVYSLGAIFYELLTGSPPFRGETPLGTLRQVIESEPERPNHRKPGIDADLETICLKCLEKGPQRRYESALALAEDLERWLRGEPIHARPVGNAERLWRWCQRNPTVGALTATVAVLLMAVALTSGYLGLEAAHAAQIAEWRAAEANDERERADDEARRAVGLAREEKRARVAAGINEGKARKNEARALEQEKVTRMEKERADRLLHLAELRLYAGQLAQAQREWQDGNGAGALNVLDRCQWDLRNVEYRLLWSLYTSNQLTLAGERALTCVAFSPDGKRLVSGSWFEGILVHDVEKRRVVRTIRDGIMGARLNGLALSPDGERIVTASGRMVKVWSAASGRQLHALEGHKGDVLSVAISADGKRIVSGSLDSTVKVWSTDTGLELLNLKGHTQPVHGVAISPDGKHIVSGSADGTVRVWGSQKGLATHTLKGHKGAVKSVAFHPEGKQIVSGGADGTVKVWNAQSGVELRTLKGHTRAVRGVTVCPDGARIVSASEDGTLKVWSARTGQELLSLRGHTREVTGVAISPNGRSIVSVSLDKTVKMWDAEKGQDVPTLAAHARPVRSVAVSRDGRRIVSGSDDGTVKVWDGGKARTLKGHKGSVRSVAISPNGQRIVSGSYDGTLKVWDAETGRELGTLLASPLPVASVAFSADGKRIVSEYDASAKVWDGSTGKMLFALKGGHEMAVTSVAFSPDDKHIATGSFDWSVKVWSAANGKELRTLKGHTFFVDSVTFSPDGKRIVSGSRDKTVKVWDVQTGEDVLTLRGHTKSVRSVTFSPDGNRIVSGSEDGTVKMWDAGTGQCLLTLKDHRGPVTSVALSGDGNHLVCGSEDGALMVWGAEREPVVLSLMEDDVGAFNLAFSPDGKRIVAGYAGGIVKVWGSQKGQVVLAVKGLGEAPISVGFSPDGKRISGKDGTGKVLTWDVTTGRLLPDARPARVRELGYEGVVANGSGSLRARIDDGEIKVVRVPQSVEARKRQQEQDRAFLQRLLRPDPAYHRQKADLYEKCGDDFAAAFHLRRLLRMGPDEAVRKRLAAVEARLAAAQAEKPLPGKRPARMPYAR
jgi:WD40 repeat protein